MGRRVTPRGIRKGCISRSLLSCLGLRPERRELNLRGEKNRPKKSLSRRSAAAHGEVEPKQDRLREMPLGERAAGPGLEIALELCCRFGRTEFELYDYMPRTITRSVLVLSGVVPLQPPGDA